MVCNVKYALTIYFYYNSSFFKIGKIDRGNTCHKKNQLESKKSETDS